MFSYFTRGWKIIWALQHYCHHVVWSDTCICLPALNNLITPQIGWKSDFLFFFLIIKGVFPSYPNVRRDPNDKTTTTILWISLFRYGSICGLHIKSHLHSWSVPWFWTLTIISSSDTWAGKCFFFFHLWRMPQLLIWPRCSFTFIFLSN